MVTEADLTRSIINALRERGGFWFKTHGGASQISGLPDIIGCYDGRFIAIEVKVPGKEKNLSPRQVFLLDTIEHAGGISGVVSDVQGALSLIGLA